MASCLTHAACWQGGGAREWLCLYLCSHCLPLFLLVPTAQQITPGRRWLAGVQPAAGPSHHELVGAARGSFYCCGRLLLLRVSV